MQVESDSLEVSLGFMLPTPPPQPLGSHIEGLHIEIPPKRFERLGTERSRRISGTAAVMQDCRSPVCGAQRKKHVFLPPPSPLPGFG